MKKVATLVLSLALAAWGTAAFAQGHGHGKPATTGIEHAQATANPRGERGIENAEAKQAVHKTAHVNHGKHKGKGHNKH
jgi:hypothetical protein